jgi:hypothetical protein
MQIVGGHDSTFSFIMFSESVYSHLLPISAIVYQLFDSHFIQFCSICLMHFCSITQCSVIHLHSVIFCLDTGIVIQVFRSYKPHINNHLASQ